MKKRHARVVWIVLWFWSVWNLSTQSAAQTRPSESVLEGAKKEGSVVWYGTMNVTDARKVIEAFEKKYPFLKVNLYRAGSQPLLNRLTAEYRSGRYLADVTETNILESYFFQKKGYFQPYRSPEARYFPAQFKDPNGFWVADYLNFYVIAYNTRMVSPPNVPRGYEDLLHPRWQNLIGLKDDTIRWYGTLMDYWGEEKGKSFMHQLVAQNPRMIRGSYGLISELTAAGEVAAGIVLAATVETLKNDKKAPVDWQSSVDPAATSIVGLYLLSKAPHPNAAKLFIDFLLSEETQRLFVTMNRVPARTDVKPKSAKLDPAKLKIVVINPEMSERFERYSQEFREIFLSGR
ncbi:MAG: extracellular solute-binding protein [Deltaproteobacteria bacterium]|nr:extracellular solute-binding protein [Deltaproteobacteria bacterium]